MSFDEPDTTFLDAKKEIEKAPVRSVTKKILVKMLLKLPAWRDIQAEFGVEMAAHYRALLDSIYLVEETKSIVEVAKEFDQELGNGKKYIALVKRYAPDITFMGAKKKSKSATVRPLTKQIIERIVLDMPLSHVVCDDFGVESADHYRALQEYIFAATEEKSLDEVAKELDQALGNGKKLTALVKKYTPEHTVTFSTVWDELQW